MASSDIISLHVRLNVHVFVYYVNSKRVRVFPVPGVRSALKLEICDSSLGEVLSHDIWCQFDDYGPGFRRTAVGVSLR